MKTKPPEPIPTAFPTCGEVFYYLIAALNLTAWADAFHAPTTKRRALSTIKALSDKLRDWATESEGHAPSRGELQAFIRGQVQALPQAKELEFVLCSLWERFLDNHANEVRKNATFLDRKGTRAWYVRILAPRTLYFLWALQKLLRRIAQSKGPMLDAPLDDLLAKAWPDAAGAKKSPGHPLHLACFKHYAELRTGETSLVDPKTLAAWQSGEDRPSFDALGRHFSQFSNKLGLVLNFAFAGLLEALTHTVRDAVSHADWPDCRQLLLGQARCVHCLDEEVATELAHVPDMSLSDYERLLSACLGDYSQFLRELPQGGADALDLRVAKFRVYLEYQHRIANPSMPSRFGEFVDRLTGLWRGTALDAPGLSLSVVETELEKLRTEHPDWSKALAGPLLAIEARLALCHEPPTSASLQRAFDLYQVAFSASRYWAGMYTASVTREALGLAALLHRRETGEGAIKPWIKKVLAWWDLLGLGPEFGQEQLERRIELAESRFTDRLNNELRARLKAALPQLGLVHWNIGGLVGFSEAGVIEQLRASPVDRRQKKPMSTTMVGRDQTPLMEAIDRGQLDLACTLVRKGDDLNFINSTGDTCVTKAFARGYYNLVLEILRRDDKPIHSDTLLRVTEKNRISGLEQTISRGQVEILRELTRPKFGRGKDIDMNVERIWGQTPLYYAVNCLSRLRMSSEEVAKHIQGLMPESKAAALFVESPEKLETVRRRLAKQSNPDGVLKCIDYLINEQHVDLDAPNVNDNTAFTFAAECGLHDVAAMLLAAGASVNHRFRGGGTGLVRAIMNNDYEMARLLLEYRADYRLFVDALGRPIYTMAMSEKMRQLIPHRL